MADTPTPLIFSGDWEYNTTLDAYEAAFEAVKLGDSWNGFATPVVTHQVMDALVARQGWLEALTPNTYDHWQWDGNGVMVTPQEEPEEVSWVMPDEEGHFDLSVMGLTFTTLDPEDRVLHVIRGAK